MVSSCFKNTAFPLSILEAEHQNIVSFRENSMALMVCLIKGEVQYARKTQIKS